ncbi:MAG: antibiotic biosynthesis monooxygenase [Candidatus Tectomicrobia bacterium]|nr:antibiotic biosynthesis monooxygenase [Candidatus Tectomicrobia bacterium]
MAVLSYLKLSFEQEAQLKDAEADIDRLMELAKTQRGYQSAEVLKAQKDPKVYVIISLWDSVEDIRAWEHHSDHARVMNRYAYKLDHKRYDSR